LSENISSANAGEARKVKSVMMESIRLQENMVHNLFCHLA
jgi:hypothetical protein